MDRYEDIVRAHGLGAVGFAQELVRIPGVNPPGEELAVAERCAGRLRAAGLRVTLDEFLPGRANVIAFAGDPDDLGLVFNGHLDVVPAPGDWLRAPFSGEIADGFLWGRGASDMKSGCAAMIEAAAAAVRSGRAFRKGLAIALVADEEGVNRGARRLRDTVNLRADACAVCEPTDLAVHIGNRGYASYFIRTHGLACHAGQPQNGVNAIYGMGRALGRLEAYAAGLAGRAHPQLGPMSMSVGTIRGGTHLNIVPDFCEIEAEVRVIPGFTAAAIQGELQDLLGDEAQVALRSDLPGSFLPEDSPLVRAAADSVRAVTGLEPIVECFPACSEASFFSVGYGIPTILLGPGDIACAHKPDERAAIAQIAQATEIYGSLVEKYCF